MSKIKIEKLSEEQIQTKGINNWPTWSKEISTFDWHYSDTEECLILKGEATIKTEKERVTIKAGDFVTFEKGLSCVWEINQDIHKHYNFI